MDRNNRLGFTYILLAVIIWSTLELTMKMIQGTASPILINLFRWVIGGLFILVYIFATKAEKSFFWFVRKYPKWYLLSAFVGLAIGMLVLTYGNSLTDASAGATIMSANPIVISAYMLTVGGEKRTLKKILGTLLGFVGVLIIVTDLNFSAFVAVDNVVGNLIVFLGMIMWCINPLIGKKVIGKKLNESDPHVVSNLDYNGASFLAAGAMMIPFIFVPGEIQLLSAFTWQTWIGIVYLGVFTSGIAYLLFFKGLESMEASRGINLFYLKPVLATILAIVVIHESPSLYFYIGIGIEVVALIFIAHE